MTHGPPVAVVGVGGLGCPAAWCLAGAGVPLRLIDEDRVEASNLHRQMLFSEADVGRLKVEAARDAILAKVPSAVIETRAEHLAPETATDLLRGACAVVEGTDNLAVKFLAADVSHALGVPVVHGAAVAWMGTVLPVQWGRSACYRCVFEHDPSEDGDEAVNCAIAGVYGPVTSVIGAVMAADALRLIRGDFRSAGALLRYDAWRQSARATVLAQRRDCPLCG